MCVCRPFLIRPHLRSNWGDRSSCMFILWLIVGLGVIGWVAICWCISGGWFSFGVYVGLVYFVCVCVLLLVDLGLPPLKTHQSAISGPSCVFVCKKRSQGKPFRTFRKTFSTFSSSRKFFRRHQNFANFNWRLRDSIDPKIIGTGAILATFRPFEISREVCPV